MLVCVYGAKCSGIDAFKVTVEVDIVQGIGIHLVGLADVAVKESLLRTTTALEALGFRVPGRKIVINLAPADMHKKGSGYDLPIAVGILSASSQGTFPNVDKYLIMGELGLDGSLRDIPGALAFAQMAHESGFKACIFPRGSALEALDMEGIDIYAAGTLMDVVAILEEKEDVSYLLVVNNADPFSAWHRGSEYPDFSEIIGQESAKRGVEIAASGGHNLIFVGPPGAGKSSLAKAMAGILPPMDRDEALTASKIYSVAGKGSNGNGLMRERPFRAPHYSASIAALIGGGGGEGIVPGEVTLAHSGILFLDELGQMSKSTVEALRGPLEDRKVCISRLKSKVEYPASFMLVAASNPCPCGFFGDADRCTCTPTQRQNYLARLSGPLLDRIDMHIWLRRVESSAIFSTARGESSSAVAARVEAARLIQRRRFAQEGICTNAEMSNRQIEKYCRLDDACIKTMESLMQRLQLSMRAYFRIIKVARTIADLACSPDIKPEHLMEAASFRFLDRTNPF